MNYIRLVFKNHRNEEEICFIPDNGLLSKEELHEEMEDQMIKGHECLCEKSDCSLDLTDKDGLLFGLWCFNRKYNIVCRGVGTKDSPKESGLYKELMSNSSNMNSIEIYVDTSEFYEEGEDILEGRNITLRELRDDLVEYGNIVLYKGNTCIDDKLCVDDVYVDDYEYLDNEVVNARLLQDNITYLIKIR